MQILLYYFISKFNACVQQKKGSCLIKINKLVLSCLIILFREGYIRGFKVVSNNRFCLIFFKYPQNSSLVLLEPASRLTVPRYFKYVALVNFVHTGHNGIISTSKGVMLCSDAVRFNVGGLLLLKFK